MPPATPILEIREGNALAAAAAERAQHEAERERHAAAGAGCARGRRGGEPRQGRIPRDAGTRAAQPAGRHRQREPAARPSAVDAAVLRAGARGDLAPGRAPHRPSPTTSSMRAAPSWADRARAPHARSHRGRRACLDTPRAGRSARTGSSASSSRHGSTPTRRAWSRSWRTWSATRSSSPRPAARSACRAGGRRRGAVVALRYGLGMPPELCSPCVRSSSRAMRRSTADRADWASA